MFIDIHVHTHRPPGVPRDNGLTYATPEQLIEWYDRLEIERAVVLPLVSPECNHVPQSNEEVLALASEFDGRFIPFCNIDPRAMTYSSDAPLTRALQFYKDKGAKGLGEITANLPFLDPMVQNLFACLQKVGMPATFHIATHVGGEYGLYDDPGLPQLQRTMAKFPDLILFGHSQPFWAEIGRLDKPGDRTGYPQYPVREEGVIPKLMRQYPNLYGDLSDGTAYNALARDHDYGPKLLDEFQDRLMFGTDLCAFDMPILLPDLLTDWRNTGTISEDVFQKVTRENAVRLFDLNT